MCEVCKNDSPRVAMSSLYQEGGMGGRYGVLGFWHEGSSAKGLEVLVPPPLLSSIQGSSGTRGGLLDEGRKELILGFSCVE